MAARDDSSMLEPEPSESRDPRDSPAPASVVVRIRGRVARADATLLCDRMRAVLQRGGADVVVCDVSAIVDPDLETADVLARLQLTARRLGRGLRLRAVPCALADLLRFLGLTDVVPCERLRLQPVGQAEQREQALGVEEGVHGDDLSS